MFLNFCPYIVKVNAFDTTLVDLKKTIGVLKKCNEYSWNKSANLWL